MATDPLRSPDDKGPIQDTNRAVKSAGAEPLVKLAPGAAYPGTVMSMNADGTYKVQVDEPKYTSNSAVLTSDLIGGMFGFTYKTVLQPGTEVLIVHGRNDYIARVIPNEPQAGETKGATSMLWGDAQDTADRSTHQDIPNDMLPGEGRLSNPFGVFVDFLTTMVRVGAGDRAVVECGLLDGVLRLASEQYRHISGLGEDHIYDFGRPTLERTWSSYRHEVLGLKEEDKKDWELSADEVDRDGLEAKRTTSIGRARYKEFMGFVGDFIHSFVTDPAEALADLAKGETRPAAQQETGKSWIHRNSDGSIIMQSLADIMLERVVRIPVPYRKRAYSDDELKRDYKSLNADFKKIPTGAVGSAAGLAYKIRTYSRWLSRYHAFARIMQLSEEYGVAAEENCPKPGSSVAPGDPPVEYIDTYACVAILRNGDIVLHDGSGSSVTMSGTDVTVSATGNLNLEAAGNITMLAGDSIFARSRKHVELYAENGGILMYSRAWLKQLCAKGSVWIRSSATTTTEAALGITPEVAQVGKNSAAGVLIESTGAGIVYKSAMGQSIIVDGAPSADLTDDDPTAYDINLHTNAHIKATAAGTVAIKSGMLMRLVSAADVVVRGAKLVVRAPYSIFSGAVGAASGLYAKMAMFNNVDANYIFAQKCAPIPGENMSSPVGAHFNHIFTREEKTDDAVDAVLDLAAGVSARDVTHADKNWVGSSNGPAFNFPDYNKTYTGSLSKLNGAAVYQSLSQQFLSDDADKEKLDKQHEYTSWSVSPVALEGPRSGASGGFDMAKTVITYTDDSMHAPAKANKLYNDLKTTTFANNLTLQCVKGAKE